MKDIVLIYPKESKTLAKKIVSKLEYDGISCWVAPRDFKQEENESVLSTIQESKLLLLIIDKNSVNNTELKQAVTLALENNIEIIPFTIEKVQANLFTEFFFHKLSWIDAYEDSFDTAYELLIETYKDITGNNPVVKKKTAKKSTNQTKIHPVVYLAAVVFIVLIGYFLYNGLKDDEITDPIIGKWAVSDYYDNLPGHSQDSLNLLKSMLQKSGRLVFKEDGAFERRGFSPEPQIGKWEFNPENKILFLTPIGSTRKEIVNIESLTKDELVIIADELVNNQKVNTKITFTKQLN